MPTDANPDTNPDVSIDHIIYATDQWVPYIRLLLYSRTAEPTA